MLDTFFAFRTFEFPSLILFVVMLLGSGFVLESWVEWRITLYCTCVGP